MTAKLTLTLDKTLVDAAKLYAKTSGIGLSKIVELHLVNLTSEKKIRPFHLV